MIVSKSMASAPTVLLIAALSCPSVTAHEKAEQRLAVDVASAPSESMAEGYSGLYEAESVSSACLADTLLVTSSSEKPDVLHVKAEAFFDKGMCNFAGSGAVESGVLIAIDPDEPTCPLTISWIDGNTVQLKLSVGCMPFYCGEAGNLDGQMLVRTHHGASQGSDKSCPDRERR